MPIKKQEFYEGAALHQMARTGYMVSIGYDPPFFLLNNHLLVLFKYSTKVRSPWGFTFTSEEQILLRARASQRKIVLGLICGGDGIAALPCDDFFKISPEGKLAAMHVACYRAHGEHYEVTGPNGKINGKIAPASWQRILRPTGDKI